MDDKNLDKIKEALVKTFRAVVPEADLGTLNPEIPIREQVDIDSMDQLNIVIRLHEILKINIPESEYKHLSSINTMTHYLGNKLQETKTN